MKSKAEMSFNLIIAGIIAVFLLIIIIALVTGRLGSTFNKFKTVEKTDIGTAKSICVSLCDELKIKVDASGTSIWESSEYCTRTFNIDKNKNNKIDEGERLFCYSPDINVDCIYLVEDQTLSMKNCQNSLTATSSSK